MLSPYEFWQFWRNTADADVGRFLNLFTELPLDETARLAALGGAEINEAKKALANEVTALCHGRAAAEAAEATARETFERGGAGEALPTVAVAVPAEGVALARLLVEAGLAASGKDAKRLIAEGGARVDDAVVADSAALVPAARFDAGPVKLSAGRKRHALAVRL
jgi:tyrosyl-tRNA synthetase